MIIDARNLNSPVSGFKLPTVTQAQAQKISRLLSKIDWKIPPAQDEEMAPLDGRASNAARADTLDISRTGLKNIKEVKLEYVYEMQYTKEDAVQNAWFNSQNTIFKLMGGTAKISDEAVIGMEKDEFAEYMKTHELDREIDWNGVENNLRGSDSYGSFSKFSDYAAATYASLEDRIKTDFSGEEQARQLEKLNEIYEKTVNEVIKDFKADTFAFEKMGAPFPEGKLENSIRAVMEQKRLAYRDYIKKHDDYANIKNGDDSWLRRDTAYMANALRNAYKPSGTSAAGDLWDEEELIAVGMAGTLFGEEAYFDNLHSLGGSDEESVGLSISMRWLKKEKLMSDYGIDGDTKKLFNDLFAKYAQTVIDRADRVNAKMKRDPVEFYASASPKLDISAVNDVLRVMQESYMRSGNANKAIQDTAKFAHDVHIKKAKMPFIWGTYSLHGNGNKYWESFYGEEGKPSSESGMAKVLQSWNSFAKLVDSRDAAAFRRQMGGGIYSFTYNKEYGGR